LEAREIAFQNRLTCRHLAMSALLLVLHLYMQTHWSQWALLLLLKQYWIFTTCLLVLVQMFQNLLVLWFLAGSPVMYVSFLNGH